jgi:hypothetical protein
VYPLILNENKKHAPVILVKAHANQDEEKKKAQLSPASSVIIVDLPSVELAERHPPLSQAVLASVKEEFGCEAELISTTVFGPYELTDDTGTISQGDLILGYPVRLLGELTNATQYHWVPLDVLQRPTIVRFAGMGHKSRCYLMAVDCLKRALHPKAGKPTHDSKEFSLNELAAT